MADRRPDTTRSVFAENLRGCTQRAGCLGDIVNQQHIASLHFAHDVDGFDLGGADALFRHQREAGTEYVRIGGGHLHAADVGRADHQIITFGLRQIFKENR